LSSKIQFASFKQRQDSETSTEPESKLEERNQEPLNFSSLPKFDISPQKLFKQVRQEKILLTLHPNSVTFPTTKFLETLRREIKSREGASWNQYLSTPLSLAGNLADQQRKQKESEFITTTFPSKKDSKHIINN
jgi:hypothetical protein